MPKKPRRRRCDECNELYSRRGGAIRCGQCYAIARGDPAALRRWWLERYSLDELQEFARALWPDLADELPWLALAA